MKLHPHRYGPHRPKDGRTVRSSGSGRAACRARANTSPEAAKVDAKLLLTPCASETLQKRVLLSSSIQNHCNVQGCSETLRFQVLSLRQSLPSQASPRPFGTAEKPRKCGLLHTKLLTAASARNTVLVSLSPVVSKAPDFAILVRNFKRLILNGYSARRTPTFRIPPVGARGNYKEMQTSPSRCGTRSRPSGPD